MCSWLQSMATSFPTCALTVSILLPLRRIKSLSSGANAASWSSIAASTSQGHESVLLWKIVYIPVVCFVLVLLLLLMMVMMGKMARLRKLERLIFSSVLFSKSHARDFLPTLPNHGTLRSWNDGNPKGLVKRSHQPKHAPFCKSVSGEIKEKRHGSKHKSRETRQDLSTRWRKWIWKSQDQRQR